MHQVAGHAENGSARMDIQISTTKTPKNLGQLLQCTTSSKIIFERQYQNDNVCTEK